jgi:hypothetical protein
MNTLSRAITAQFFTTPESYDTLRRRWSALVNSSRRHDLTASHHVLYLALCGKDWRRAFTPITNSRKLDNGAFYGWALFRALRRLHSPLYDEALLAPFEGIVTPEMLRAVRGFVPGLNPYSFLPGAYGPGSFPVDAYSVPRDAAAATR